jgi:uroporphyrin-III C-methyltransferase / precorrin-2 dehydrogenase / sirohydrochlorin ferrochelatase
MYVALTCAACSGMPPRHHDRAQFAQLDAAHGQHFLNSLDWAELAREQQTSAIYMGVSKLDEITRQLLAHGPGPDTPFVLIEEGSLPTQRTLAGTLANLPMLASRYAIHAPALLILGEVAAQAEAFHWHGELLGADRHEVIPRTRLADAA